MPSGGHNKISREELLRALADLRDELGEVPRLKDWREKGEYSAKAIYNEFDNWNAALDELDMEKHHVVNKERLTFECDGPDCEEIVEKLPSDAEASERHYCSQACHYAHKSERYTGEGNPQSTLEAVECAACGQYVLKPQWDRERYDRHFCDNDCYADWCSDVRHGERHPDWVEYPTLECEMCGQSFKVRPAKSEFARFCSWVCVNEWKCDAYSGEGNHNYEGGHEQYMGANWGKQRAKAIVRDGGRCVLCGTGTHDHLRRYGRELNVHHITPRSEFRDGDRLDWKSANLIENLVSLCDGCHTKAEAKSYQFGRLV